MITWLAPVAGVGLLALAIPLVIHWLMRRQTRRVVFPSVRFLPYTPLSALSRARLSDWPLLIVRLLILAVAVGALAGPVVHWPGREDMWATRVSRAVVLEPGVSRKAVELPATFAEATFARPESRASIGDALRWLDAQPRSAREIVFAGPQLQGWITGADLAEIPDEVGVRFARADSPASEGRGLVFLERRADQLYRVTRAMTVSDRDTVLREVSAEPVSSSPIAVVADAAERSEAEAALAAVLNRGVRLPVDRDGPAAEAIVVRWPGSLAALAAAVDRALEDPLDRFEIYRIDDEQLSAWSRPSGQPAAEALPFDGGDRRVFWGVVLVLLAIEWRLRGRRATVTPVRGTEEARVA